MTLLKFNVDYADNQRGIASEKSRNGARASGANDAKGVGEFNEEDHPRDPGGGDGGQFIAKGEAGIDDGGKEAYKNELKGAGFSTESTPEKRGTLKPEQSAGDVRSNLVARLDGQRTDAANPTSFIEARNKTSRPGYLSPLAPDDLKEHKLVLLHGGKAGAAVSKEGDIQNVFNNGGPKGAGSEALIAAMKNGGGTLDCYDGYLTKYYAQAGFTETGRMKFNREFAPKDWDYENQGEPDVVFMSRTKEVNEDAIREQHSKRYSDWEQPAKSDKYYEDWDAAKSDSRGAAIFSGRGEGGGASPDPSRAKPLDSAGQAGGATVEAKPSFKAKGDGSKKYPRPLDQAKIDSVRAGKVDSLEKHKDGGNLKPERRKLWESIKSEFIPAGIKTPTDRKAVMVMTGGGPASGKSTMLESGGVRLPDSFVHIDPDAVKGKIPEYNELIEAGDRTAAPYAHEESSSIGNELQLHAIKSKVDTVVDGTGNGGFDKLRKRVERAREAGMSPVAYYATNDTELAVKLSRARGEKTGRFVPDDVVRGIHAEVSRIVPKVLEADLFDDFKLFDTNEQGNARLVVTKERGAPAVIHDKKLWDNFLEKGKAINERR